MGDNDDDGCMDGEGGIIQKLRDCMNPDGESGVDERDD